MHAVVKRTALCLLLLATVNACAIFTLPEKEITALVQVPSGYVLLVGKVELTPALLGTEIELDIRNDIFNTEDMMSNRAIIGMSSRPDVSVEKSGFLINPQLGRTFYFAVPKERIHMVSGYITVAFDTGANGRYGGSLHHAKIILPRNLRLDIRPTDTNIYIGTLSIQRGPFNEVIEARIINDYASASADFKRRFGAANTLRQALPTLPRS